MHSTKERNGGLDVMIVIVLKQWIFLVTPFTHNDNPFILFKKISGKSGSKKHHLAFYILQPAVCSVQF